jgi:endonuclease/exonuclease/phosphatase (EEP) superfamily protein YafD
MSAPSRRPAGASGWAGWLGWAAIAGMGSVAALPWIGALRSRTAAVARATMPWATIPAVPVALAGARSGRRPMALAAAAVAAAGLAPSLRLVRPPLRRTRAMGRDPLSVVHANLQFDNIRISDVAAAIEPLGVDVVTFSEYTPHHARILRATRLATAYPHRIEMPAPLASGTALWSRHPVRWVSPPATRHHTIVGDVELGTGSIRVVVVHAQSPVGHHGQWYDDLSLLSELRSEQPAVMTGDFNAGWWHPEFRQIVRNGWRDVHVVVGRGLSPSWPVDHRLVPAFARLDHALINDGLTVDDVGDFPIPGSDHRGLVVTVSRAD